VKVVKIGVHLRTLSQN